MVDEMTKPEDSTRFDASHSRIRTLDNGPFIGRLRVMK